jgi:heme exporter protein CcmD
MLALMEDAGFVIGSYVATFGAVAAYAVYVLRRARRVTRRLPDEAKPWT